VQLGGEILAPEIVGIGLPGGTQGLELLAALVDQFVLFVLQAKPPASGLLR
jgi:hypothetical protein